MSQTLVMSTPDVVSTTSRTLPKQGMFNLKITKNGEFDTVELWFRSGASNMILELAGASFQATAQGGASRAIPPNPTVISGSTLAITPDIMQYMKIKLNNGISVAYLRCSYSAVNMNTIVAGGNVKGQAFVDYSKKPYIVSNMDNMFVGDSVKNDLTKWDVSSVISMRKVFENNLNFNQNIGNWDTSNVTTMFSLFFNCTAFNQDISGWDVSNVKVMNMMFNGAVNFNQPIGDWNVSNVTGIYLMFSGTNFNQDISRWDVSNVANMEGTFSRAVSFNQPIGDWNVSNVTNMKGMFTGATNFNQPIDNWDISNITNMGSMFLGATNFNQDLSSWAAKFHVDVALDSFFRLNAWGTTNYDKFLNALWTDINTTRPQAWALRTVPKSLGMGTSKYSAASAAARASLVSNGWTITDGGLTA